MKWLKPKRRPAHTLLFITEAKSFRVDADRKGVLLGDAAGLDFGCKSVAGLAKTLARIAENGPPLGRNLWLLYIRLPALHISLPSMQVNGVDDATLAQALQFEAEGMTGVSSQDMATGYRFLKTEDEMSDYWLVQMEPLAWEDLLKAAKQLKCRLAGVTHPGLLPSALQDTEAHDWLRLEAWSTQILALYRSEGKLDLLALGFDNPHWQTELEHWLEERADAGLTEALLNNRMEYLPETGRQYVLNETLQLTQWLGLWMQALAVSKGAEAALLKPVAKVNPDLAWMAGSGAAALLLCGLHAAWFIHARTYHEAETARLAQLEKRQTELRTQIGASNQEREKLQKKLNRITSDSDAIPSTLKNLQQRPALLLQALAAGRQPQLIIETLESKGDEIVIGGVSLDQQLPNQLASFLNERLPALHWAIESPTKENMILFEDVAGPWSFKLKLTDQGIPGFEHDKGGAKDKKT